MIATLLLASLCSIPPLQTAQGPATQMWRAWLGSPGGDLPFQLEVQQNSKEPPAATWQAWVHNGSERIEIPVVRWEEDTRLLVLEMPHYDSRLQATVSIDGKEMDGRWRKRRGLEKWADMAFHARHYGAEAPRFLPSQKHPGQVERPSSPIDARWWIQFSSSKDLAVGVFAETDAGAVQGTILTTLGDYRFLAGERQGGQLRLSCFDGAHAFLFTAARVGEEWHGDFYSSDSWHETWKAQADPQAQLPDSFAEIALAAGLDPQAPLPLKDLSFPGLDGEEQSLGDPALYGKATIISLFGSWCPNCNDEAALWAELHELYHERGLRILGLGFELTGDQDRDLEQLVRFRDRWKLKHPLLLAGSANKQQAQEVFPLLAQVKSFPTALFLDAQGRVRAIHSGFSGPATGDAHVHLRERYTSLIEELLAEASKTEADQTW